MIDRDTLVHYIDNLLSVADFSDYAPNGLQVAGRDEITTVASAVTASQAAIEAAIAAQADVLLVHHGYFWKGESPCLVGPKRQRLASLLTSEMNLLAYHLPLDAHGAVGNNVQLARQLNWPLLTVPSEWAWPRWIYAAEFAQPQQGEALALHIEQTLQRKPLHISADRPIKRIAFCTGGAQSYLALAAAQGFDAYLSGEISEQTYHEAKEWGIHYFAAGHHATERYGVLALAEYLAQEFNLIHHSIDINNPV